MYIKTGTERVFVDVPLTATVHSLKEGIAKVLHIQPDENMKLIWKGKQLMDNSIQLDACGISDEDNIFLLHHTTNSKIVHIMVKTVQDELKIPVSVSTSDTISRMRNGLAKKYSIFVSDFNEITPPKILRNNTKVKEKFSLLLIINYSQKFRKILEERLPSLPKNYNLIWNGIILEDERTFSDYGLKEGSTVYIVSKIVVEVEGPTGKKLKIDLNDSALTAEIVEKLTEHSSKSPLSVRVHRTKRARTNEFASTTTSTSTSATPSSSTTSFGGLKRGFLYKNSKQEKATSTKISPSIQKDTTRCWMCKKRIGLTGIKCKCGYTFCSLHRYDKEHGCTFDYKTKGKEVLQKQNPKIEGEKLPAF